MVTQREEIEQFLDRVAAAATADNLKQLVDAVDPAAVPLRQEAVQAFSQFKINEFVYNRRRIAVVDGAVEPTATADVDLTVMVARRRRGVYQESEKVSIDARLTLGKLKEQWCVRMLDVKSIITAERNIGGP